MQMDAHIMLKPLKLKGALLDKNKAETTFRKMIRIETHKMGL